MLGTRQGGSFEKETWLMGIHGELEIPELKWNAWLDMIQLKWMTWHEGIQTHELKWMTCHEWIEGNELPKVLWTRSFLRCFLGKSSSRYSLVNILSTPSSKKWPEPLSVLRFYVINYLTTMWWHMKSSRFSLVHILSTSPWKSGPRPSVFFDVNVRSSSRYSLVRFLSTALQRRPRTHFTRKNTQGFAPESVFSSMNSSVPDCSHFPTTWWWCGWHDDVVDMVIEMMMRLPWWWDS